jgi:hypothetical protein
MSGSSNLASLHNNPLTESLELSMFANSDYECGCCMCAWDTKWGCYWTKCLRQWIGVTLIFCHEILLIFVIFTSLSCLLAALLSGGCWPFDCCWIHSLFLLFFFKRYIAKKVCTACLRTSYKIVPLSNFYKYLHSDISETEVIINKCK